jgi:uncharacterized protein
MRTPLQEQLLKAGLTKKHKVAAAVREQNQQRKGKAPAAHNEEQVSAAKLQAERAERDRALAAEQNALAHAKELRAQIRQIVETHKVARSGEIPYRFTDNGAIKEFLVNTALRNQLAKGALVIVDHNDGYELLPRAAAEKIYERGGTSVLDHGRSEARAEPSDDDAYYQRFVVPDDLIW